MTSQRLGAILMLGTLAACGSAPKRTFRFQAVDTAEKALHCIVVVDDNWDNATENARVCGDNPLPVEIEFAKPSIDVTIMQVTVDDAGKMLAPPRSRSGDSEYRTQIRPLGPNDPPEQLFILERR